ncbi:uncharacterized protein LOC143629949 [Bidens hawaiensis]|uniref:uncharacterized protein LOC143629949 n=1 Tax=Bidens hawaiensis TaxID=980011 RepID=UPI004049C775
MESHALSQGCHHDDGSVWYKCVMGDVEEFIVGTAKPHVGRLRVPLAVQDSTGTISLTLFDCEACRLLKTTGGDNGDTPAKFDALVGKMFAFKIEITQYNIDNGSSVFGISKLTDNVDIIFELEKKANNFEVDKSASLSIGFNDTQSQGTVEFMSVNSEEVIM